MIVSTLFVVVQIQKSRDTCQNSTYLGEITAEIVFGSIEIYTNAAYLSMKYKGWSRNDEFMSNINIRIRSFQQIFHPTSKLKYNIVELKY